MKGEWAERERMFLVESGGETHGRDGSTMKIYGKRKRTHGKRMENYEKLDGSSPLTCMFRSKRARCELRV